MKTARAVCTESESNYSRALAELNRMFPPEFQLVLTHAQRSYGFRYSERGQLYWVDFERLVYQRADAREAQLVELRAQRRRQRSCRDDDATQQQHNGVIIGADCVDDSTCFFDLELCVASN